MKKWVKFFICSFFSHKTSKEATQRGYSNLFLGLLLTFAFLWAGTIGGELLPFGARYQRAADFRATVHTVLANSDSHNSIEIEIQDGNLVAKKQGSESTATLLVNTFKSEGDRQVYSTHGYDVVVDTRPADMLAEVEAYCVSNDGKELEISYEEYLTLSDVAKLNFDFKLRYTGNELVLDDALVATYKAYVLGMDDEKKSEVEQLDSDLSAGKVTKSDYDKSIYQLYFATYYPSITEYESSSKVPLLRNYYYHQYIKTGSNSKYLFIFNDYMAGSFETSGGSSYSFYGFYNNMEEGKWIDEGMGEAERLASADEFVKTAFGAMAPITAYAHAMNIFSFIPFIALMPLVVALMAYSILKLRGVGGIKTFGDVAKIIGSYVWFSGIVSAVLTIALSFFVGAGLLTALPLVLFFVTLLVRSIIFAVNESKAFKKQLEQALPQTEE